MIEPELFFCEYHEPALLVPIPQLVLIMHATGRWNAKLIIPRNSLLSSIPVTLVNRERYIAKL